MFTRNGAENKATVRPPPTLQGERQELNGLVLNALLENKLGVLSVERGTQRPKCVSKTIGHAALALNGKTTGNGSVQSMSVEDQTEDQHACQCCFTSTETIRIIRPDREPRTATSTFTQLQSSDWHWMDGKIRPEWLHPWAAVCVKTEFQPAGGGASICVKTEFQPAGGRGQYLCEDRISTRRRRGPVSV